MSDQGQLVAGIVNHWLRVLGRPFPRDYVVLDTETTGPDAASDLILSVGHVIVEDGIVVDELDAVLDWTAHPAVDQAWLRNRMAYTREQMAKGGRDYRMSYEGLVGRADPPAALAEYRDLIRAHQAGGYAFVMHNGYNFDAPRLCGAFDRWAPPGPPVEFGPNDIWDTGMLEKAGQINSVPDAADTMRGWARRVGGVRAKGVLWALDRHCVPKYDLAARHGLDMTLAHGAGFDARVTHLLFETFRELAERHRGLPYLPPDRPPTPPPARRQAWDSDPGGRHGHLG